MESAVQHGAAAFVAGVQATGAEGNPAQARGAWRCGKRSAFPTSPHPRRRLRTNFKRGATLTIYLVQNPGQASLAVSRDTVIRWIHRGHLKAFRFPVPGRTRKRSYESYRIRSSDGELFIRKWMTS